MINMIKSTSNDSEVDAVFQTALEIDRTLIMM